MPLFARIAPLVLSSFMLLWSGCGSGPETFPVVGTVLLDERPLAGVQVRFVPQSGTRGHGGDGLTDEQGRYEIIASHRDKRKGLPLGTYKVVFSKVLRLDGSVLPPNVPLSADAKESVPEPFCNLHKTPFVIPVEVGEKLYDFSLLTGK